MFGPSDSQDIERGRTLYDEAIGLFDVNANLSNTEIYLYDLYEYGSMEMKFGDFQCGDNIAGYALSLMKIISPSDNNPRFQSNFRNSSDDYEMTRKITRTSIGSCKHIALSDMPRLILAANPSSNGAVLHAPVFASDAPVSMLQAPWFDIFLPLGWADRSKAR